MGKSEPDRKPSERLRSNIKWWILIPCLLMIAAGVLLLLPNIPEGTKYFVSGALIGIGASGGLSEIAAASERRESRGNIRELREGGFAQCRLAYRMGEFSFNFYAAISKGHTQDRHVLEFLALGDTLGIRSTLQSLVTNANPQDPNLYNRLLEPVESAMVFSGRHMYSFYKLGQDVRAIRGDDAKTNVAARMQVIMQIAAQLKEVKGFTNGARVDEAWANFSQLWNQGKLESNEIDGLLSAFHCYFLLLGLGQLGAQTWEEILNELSQIKIREDRPTELTSILAKISAAMS